MAGLATGLVVSSTSTLALFSVDKDLNKKHDLWKNGNRGLELRFLFLFEPYVCKGSGCF